MEGEEEKVEGEEAEVIWPEPAEEPEREPAEPWARGDGNER